MATGVDPEEDEGTRYSDARGTTLVSPTPSMTEGRPFSETPTSEHGGRNEPLPPTSAGTPLPATNLAQRLETAVVTEPVPPGNTVTSNQPEVQADASTTAGTAQRTVPAAFRHIRIPDDPERLRMVAQTPDPGSVGITQDQVQTEARNNTTVRGREPEGSVGTSTHNTRYYSTQSTWSDPEESVGDIETRFEQADHKVSEVIGEI